MNRFIRAALCVLTACSVAFFSQAGVAETDIFLKMTDIPGESLDEDHKDEIEILAWQWSYAAPELNYVGNRSIPSYGATVCEPISCVHYFDKASPKIALYGFTRDGIEEAVLTVRTTGDSPTEYVVIKLTDAWVNAQNMGGKESESRLTEKFSLSFGKIEIEYTTPSGADSGSAPVAFGWDCRSSSPL